MQHQQRLLKTLAEIGSLGMQACQNDHDQRMYDGLLIANLEGIVRQAEKREPTSPVKCFVCEQKPGVTTLRGELVCQGCFENYETFGGAR